MRSDMNNKISAHDPEPMIMLHKDRILVTVLSSPALYQWWGDGVVHLLCINGGEMEWCTFSNGMSTGNSPCAVGVPD